MKNQEKKILEEIKRFNDIINYNFLLNEGVIGKLSAQSVEGAIKLGILNGIKNASKETLETIVKSSGKNLASVTDINKLYKTALPAMEKALLDAGLDKIDDLTRTAIKNNYNTIVKSQGDDLLKSAKQLFGSTINDNAVIMTKTASQYVESILKKIPSKVKSAVDNIFIEPQVGIEAAQIATKNPGLQKSLDDAAKLVNAGTPPPIDRIIPTLNKSGLLQTTKKGGIEITTKNLKRVAFFVGGGTVALSLIGYLLDNGVTVQEDSVGTGGGFDGEFACAKPWGTPIKSGYKDRYYIDYVTKKGEKPPIPTLLPSTTYTFYDNGAYFIKTPKGDRVPATEDEFFKYTCSNGTIVKDYGTMTMTELEKSTGESEQTQTTQPGSQYSGPRKWRSLGPKYNAEIKTALGKSGTDLTDEDIKDIYDRLNKAGKIKN
jgi:hypothetical protein